MRLALPLLAMLAACDTAPAVAPATSQAPAVWPGDAAPAGAPPIAKASLDAAGTAILNEPKVVDFNYRPDDFVQWIVAVEDDGSPRFGYAGHICLLLDKHGVPRDGQRVRITDIRAQREHGEDFAAASLGAVRCNDAGHLDAAPAVG